MDFLWSIAESQGDVGGVPRELERLRPKSGAGSDDVARLTRQIERLTLASQALWELLRESANTTFNDDKLLAKMEEIDLRDGRADGKIGTVPLQCPKCQRMSNSRRDSCMYCGTEFEREHVFEG